MSVLPHHAAASRTTLLFFLRFGSGRTYAAGSHMAGPVVPTVPFWNSLGQRAKQSRVQNEVVLR